MLCPKALPIDRTILFVAQFSLEADPGFPQ